MPGLTPAGAATGVFSTAGCLADGARGGAAALAALGFDDAPPIDVPEAEDAPYAMTPLWAVPGKGRAWLDFQNDVTVKDVRLAAQENFRSVEHMKRYTTQGMATDQGKNSNVAALAVLADATGRGIPETGTTTFRPPYTSRLHRRDGGGRRRARASRRSGFTTSHAAAVERGAPMIEAGLWYRPSYFPRAGEATWREACDREVAMVRDAVGVCDVSTLGKIDIQGPDAARVPRFRLYQHLLDPEAGARALRPDAARGRARDGRRHHRAAGRAALPDDHDHRRGGPVMRHLEFVQQALVPRSRRAHRSR